MKISEDVMTRLANRAAECLAGWLGVSLGNRYHGSSGEAMALAVLADRSSPPPADVQERLAAGILAAMKDRHKRGRDGVFLAYSTDYGPEHELVDLMKATGLENLAWPWKSRLTITTTFSDGSGSEMVEDKRRTCYKLCSDGWLICEGFDVDKRILDICITAAKAGHPAMRWESLDGVRMPRTAIIFGGSPTDDSWGFAESQQTDSFPMHGETLGSMGCTGMIAVRVADWCAALKAAQR